MKILVVNAVQYGTIALYSKAEQITDDYAAKAAKYIENFLEESSDNIVILSNIAFPPNYRDGIMSENSVDIQIPLEITEVLNKYSNTKDNFIRVYSSTRSEFLDSGALGIVIGLVEKFGFIESIEGMGLLYETFFTPLLASLIFSSGTESIGRFIMNGEVTPVIEEDYKKWEQYSQLFLRTGDM